ncbi:type II toxin-antitoxin system VapC family toxin [Bacillus albus]|uniref:type II toxin-antitoxin system VapC family toxin n=1 Tax=Bacillus albus TaxID=2026189 RepID=UPI003D1E266F
MYLLDTNHCSRIINKDSVILQKLRVLGEVRVATAFIVEAELHFMVNKSVKKEENLLAVQAFLDTIEVLRESEQVSTIYGNLKARLLERYGPKDKKKQRKTKLHKIGIGENDLWIAATAIAYDYTIVTQDGDFERIREVEARLRLDNWIPTSSEVSATN